MAEDIKNLSMNIVVDDGSRRVPILNMNGEEIGAFTFHPTDLGIIKRYNELVNDFDRVVEPLEAVTAGDDAAADVSDPKYAEAMREAEGRLYEAVDRLLGGSGAAEAFFGKMSPFSPVNGEFYCAGVLNAVGEYIGAQFEAETARFGEKAKKYAKKAAKRP